MGLARVLFAKLSHQYNLWVKPIYDPMYRRMIPAYRRWVVDNVDDKLRTTFELKKSSVAFDIGGFQGDWTDAIQLKYGCTIHVFEPCKSYAAAIAKRFEVAPGVTVHPYGLSDSDGEIELHILGEGTSAYRGNGQIERAKMRDICGVLSELKLDRIDVVKVNIEGGEYPLLERMIQTGLISRISFLLVQFHNIDRDSPRKHELLRQQLELTHNLDWSYFFVWERWSLRTQLKRDGKASA